MEEAQARAAKHGEELREWHADDRLTSPGSSAVDAIEAVDAVEAVDPFEPVEAPSDEVARVGEDPSERRPEAGDVA